MLKFGCPIWIIVGNMTSGAQLTIRITAMDGCGNLTVWLVDGGVNKQELAVQRYVVKLFNMLLDKLEIHVMALIKYVT